MLNEEFFERYYPVRTRQHHARLRDRLGTRGQTLARRRRARFGWLWGRFSPGGSIKVAYCGSVGLAVLVSGHFGGF